MIGPVLIAGYGSIGRRHFRNLQSLGCRDFVFLRTGAGTISDDEVRSYPAVRTVEEALSYNPRVAIIANPTALHLNIAIQAARGGCDLYIEKPLSHSADGIESLVSIVKERKLVVMIGCQYRFHPLFAELHSQVVAGRLGTIVGASASWGEYLPGWHPWEDHRKSYSSRPELGGGVILTLIHPIDYLQAMFGVARRVQASSMAIAELETSAGEDWADILLEYPNRVLAHVHVDYLQRPPSHSLQVFGTAGKAELDFQKGALTWVTGIGQVESSSVPEAFERNIMFLDAMRHFLSCVVERTAPMVTLNDGVTALKTALAAQQSAAA